MEDFTDYFNQREMYWSESQRQFISIKDMPFQQAFYSHRKLIREHGLNVYAGTPLYQAFIEKVCPPCDQIRDQLKRYGKACHAAFDPGMMAKTNGTRVRAKMYQTAKSIGMKIHTHKVDTNVGDYIEATVIVTMAVTRRGERIV